MTKTKRNRLSTKILLLTPTVSLLSVTFLYPLMYAIMISLSSSTSILSQNLEWVGLRNYLAVLTSSKFLTALLNTVRFVIITLSFEFIFGFCVSLLLHNRKSNSAGFRLVFSLPLMIAPVVSGLQWRWLFADQYGAINFCLEAIGAKSIIWLATPMGANSSVVIANLWLATPFVIMVLMAGLSNSSQALKEAGMIDGANGKQQFIHIILPQLKPTILIILVIRLTDAFRIYDLVYILTGGGPGGSTEMLSTYVYKSMFTNLRFGSGAAASLLISMIIFILSLFLNRQFHKGDA